MAKAGLVMYNLESKDNRRNVAILTETGKLLSYKIIKVQYNDIDAAVENLISEATHNLWGAVKQWEYLLEKKSLLKRVQEQKKISESKDVKIVEFEP